MRSLFVILPIDLGGAVVHRHNKGNAYFSAFICHVTTVPTPVNRLSLSKNISTRVLVLLDIPLGIYVERYHSYSGLLQYESSPYLRLQLQCNKKKGQVTRYRLEHYTKTPETTS